MGAVGRLPLGHAHCYDLNVNMELISSRSVGIGVERFLTGNAVYMWKPLGIQESAFPSRLHDWYYDAVRQCCDSLGGIPTVSIGRWNRSGQAIEALLVQASVQRAGRDHCARPYRRALSQGRLERLEAIRHARHNPDPGSALGARPG